MKFQFLYITLFAVLFQFFGCSKKTVAPTIQKEVAQNDAWRATPPSAAAPRNVELGEYHTYSLDNGLKVIVVENHKLPRVSYQLSFNHDPILEKNKIGYVEFAGDLISKGTTTRSKSDIDNAIDFIGASLNTSPTGIYASSLKKHSVKLLDVMTDVLYHPSYPEDELSKLKKRAISGLAASKSNPESIAANVRHVVDFGTKHPYGEVQTEETLKNISTADCKNYIDTYFRPNNAYLVIVGDITPETAIQQAKEYFSNWKSGEIPTVSYDVPKKTDGNQVHFANKDGAVQSVINITYPIEFSPGNPDAIKASVMSSLLGGSSFSGRLMQNLREKHAYTYGARCNLSSDKLIGNFNAFASVRNVVTDSSIVQFLYEMDRINNEKVETKELSLIKNSMSGSFARSLESPQTIANFALNVFRYNLPKDYYNNYLKNLEAVNADDVMAMAHKYIKGQNANIVVVGNEGQVASNLVQFDSDGVIDYYDPFGNKIEQPKFEMPAGITPKAIIDGYVASLGGSDKLNAIKNVSIVYGAEIMGQNGKLTQIQSAEGKYAMKLEVMGMTMQEQKFDGSKGLNIAMGNKKTIEDADELQKLREQTIIFPQLTYFDGSKELSIVGLENVQSLDAYKIKIVEKNGDESFEFYDVRTGRLLRSTKIFGSGDNVKAITTDYSNYKPVNGVLFPYSVTTVGVAPVPLIFNAESIEVNKELSDDIFSIE